MNMIMSKVISKCLRCLYKWATRKKGRPVECPNCKNRNWDRKK
jgi:DNA-directed RNA polymerase subunit RPC12/RpoP